MAAQGAALRSLAQRLQELPLEDLDRDQLESVAHSARMIQTSAAYTSRTLDSMIPMLESVNDLLFSPQANSLADASLSPSERASRNIAFVEKIRKLPGFSEGVEELSQNVPGMSSLVNHQLDSLISRMRDFEAAANRPGLPDLTGLPEFRHSCLATRTSIRVLKVETLDHTTSDTNPNLIKLRMDEVNLADNPNFNALSYVWGDHRAPLGQDNKKN